MLGQIIQANLALLERWEDKAARRENINLTEDVSDLILKIVLETIFSEDLDAFIEATGENPFAILTGEPERNLQFAVKFRALAKLIGEIINQRRRDNRNPFDFLTMLMTSRDKQTGEPMSDKQCVGEFLAMVEMQLHIGLVARKFKLRYVPDKPIELEPQVNLRSKHPFFMSLEKR